jgi:hypothetical protein
MNDINSLVRVKMTIITSFLRICTSLPETLCTQKHIRFQRVGKKNEEKIDNEMICEARMRLSALVTKFTR